MPARVPVVHIHLGGGAAGPPPRAPRAPGAWRAAPLARGPPEAATARRPQSVPRREESTGAQPRGGAAAALAGRATQSSKPPPDYYRDRAFAELVPRSEAWAAQRELKLQQLRDERYVKECPFKPRLSGNRRVATPVGSGIDRSPGHSADAMGRLAERQRGAPTGGRQNRWSADIDLSVPTHVQTQSPRAAKATTVSLEVSGDTGADDVSFRGPNATVVDVRSYDCNDVGGNTGDAEAVSRGEKADAAFGAREHTTMLRGAIGALMNATRSPSVPSRSSQTIAERSDAWLACREQKRAALREKHESEQGDFTPRLHRPERSPRWLAGPEGGGDLHERGLRSKARLLCRQRRREEEQLEEDLRQCPFEPDISESWPPPWPATPPERQGAQGTLDRRPPSSWAASREAVTPEPWTPLPPGESPAEVGAGEEELRSRSWRPPEAASPVREPIGKELAESRRSTRSPSRSAQRPRAVTPEQASEFYEQQRSWDEARQGKVDFRWKDKMERTRHSEEQARQPSASMAFTPPPRGQPARSIYDRQILWSKQRDSDLEQLRQAQLEDMLGTNRRDRGRCCPSPLAASASASASSAGARRRAGSAPASSARPPTPPPMMQAAWEGEEAEGSEEREAAPVQDASAALLARLRLMRDESRRECASAGAPARPPSRSRGRGQPSSPAPGTPRATTPPANTGRGGSDGVGWARPRSRDPATPREGGGASAAGAASAPRTRTGTPRHRRSAAPQGDAPPIPPPGRYTFQAGAQGPVDSASVEDCPWDADVAPPVPRAGGVPHGENSRAMDHFGELLHVLTGGIKPP